MNPLEILSRFGEVLHRSAILDGHEKIEQAEMKGQATGREETFTVDLFEQNDKGWFLSHLDMLAGVEDIREEYRDTVLERLMSEGRQQKNKVNKHIKKLGL